MSPRTAVVCVAPMRIPVLISHPMAASRPLELDSDPKGCVDANFATGRPVRHQSKGACAEIGFKRNSKAE